MTYEQPTLSLEGDYAAYTQSWLSAAVATDLTNIDWGFIDIPNNRIFIHGSNSRYAILNLADGTIIEEGDSNSGWGVTQTMVASVLGKYVAFSISGTEIRVYKNGALLQTITIALKTVEVGLVMSSDGQYLVFYDGTDDKIYCWKGA